MKGGGGAERECERKRALGVLLCHSLLVCYRSDVRVFITTPCVYYSSTYYKAVRVGVLKLFPVPSVLLYQMMKYGVHFVLGYDCTF